MAERAIARSLCGAALRSPLGVVAKAKVIPDGYYVSSGYLVARMGGGVYTYNDAANQWFILEGADEGGAATGNIQEIGGYLYAACESGLKKWDTDLAPPEWVLIGNDISAELGGSAGAWFGEHGGTFYLETDQDVIYELVAGTWTEVDDIPDELLIVDGLRWGGQSGAYNPAMPTLDPDFWHEAAAAEGASDPESSIYDSHDGAVYYPASWFYTQGIRFSPSETATYVYRGHPPVKAPAQEIDQGLFPTSMIWGVARSGVIYYAATASDDADAGVLRFVSGSWEYVGLNNEWPDKSGWESEVGSAPSAVLALSSVEIVGATNNAPAVTITAPVLATSQYDSGEEVTLTGEAEDQEDGDISADIVWTSSIDGELGTGASIDADSLSDGVHTITANVTDSAGATDLTPPTRTVKMGQPSLTIDTPAEFDEVESPVTFEGTAMDNTDGNISANIVWTSDLDGTLGTGASIEAELSPDEHLITATITDSHGITVSVEILITVN